MKTSLLKKNLFILLIIILLFAITKANKILKKVNNFKEYIITRDKYLTSDEFYQKLVNRGIIKKCYVPHPDIIEIFAQEGFNYEKLDKEFTTASLNKLKDPNIKAGDISKIPTISHKVYFAPQNNKVKLNDFYIEELKTNFNRLNSLSVEWQHIIWTNQADLFPNEVTSIKGVEIRSILEFESHPSYKNLLEIIDKGNNFKPHLAEASDLLRLMAVQKYGGVYSDMDYEIYKPTELFKLIRKFDFIITRETIRIHSMYPNGFIAAKPNHPILNEALARSLRNYNLKDNDNIPEYLKYPCNRYDRLFFSGTVLTTLAYFAKNNIDGNSDIILPSWMSINVEFAKYKNQTCKLAEITKASFKERNNKLKVLLADFIADPQLPEWQYACNKNDPSAQSIYYNIKDHAQFDIIGADMSCGTWITDNHQKFYYCNFPFSKN